MPLLTFRRPRGVCLPSLQPLAAQKPPVGSTELVRAPGPLDPTTLPETKPALAELRIVRGLGRAPCSLLLPPYLEPLRLHFRYVLQTLVRTTATGTQLAQFGVLTSVRRCRAFPSRNPWLKLVHGTRDAPKCRLRSYHARDYPAWSGTPWHWRSCWYAEQSRRNTD
jgi:hypothetical protein